MEVSHMHARHRTGFQRQVRGLTLGDAVAAVSAVTCDEREVVAVVLHMLRRQSIRLACARPLLHRADPAPSDGGLFTADRAQRRAEIHR
jgi:hypothetical protein